ncbi:hypothetical protein AB6D06_22450 [Vibrio sp. 10N.239.311.G01]|uniref:hypothetical protein n=1 Tax=Vibrio sp. 10N.239.311.G01 TaxID=3229976 RepID=UPI00354D7761
MTLAGDFFEHWCSVVEERDDEVNQNWCNNKAYTNFIIHSENSVVMDIAKRLGLYCYNADYYYLDSVFYDQTDFIDDFPNQCYLTNIRIAFEHENNFKSGLFQEVSHLLLINSQLKVVVSYPPCEESEKVELEYLHRIINSSPISKELSDKKGFLFIMGHADPYKWVAWIYHQSAWQKIANKSLNRDS